MLSLDLETAIFFGEAIAIGLLVGIERYKDKNQEEKRTAGVRTFTGICFLGALSALIDQPLLTGLTFAAVATLLTAGYMRDPSESIGLTTEVAALVTFWLGFVLRRHETLAISAAIVMVILLASKRGLHDFVAETISEAEFYDTLKFLAVVFVVFPLLPNKNIDPWDFFNPAKVWGLIILVSTISYFGYILIRVLGPRQGLMASSLLGGLVSTTAVTMSLAERAQKSSGSSRLFGVMAVTANAMQFPRLLALIWVADRSLGSFLAPVLPAMFVAGLAGTWLWSRGSQGDEGAGPVDLPLTNPYSLMPALKFGLFFVSVFLISKLATNWLGESGIYWISAISGMASAGAATLSIANLSSGGTLSTASAALAVLLAVGVNALVKWILAVVHGSRQFSYWLGGGLATMLITGIAIVLALRAF